MSIDHEQLRANLLIAIDNGLPQKDPVLWEEIRIAYLDSIEALRKEAFDPTGREDFFKFYGKIAKGNIRNG